ncbi:MAG TPA: hypothetical protein PLF26_18265 [Blastocatellia bacterium]|nr:hypothetical protein [Blastocatellia bacterium]
MNLANFVATALRYKGVLFAYLMVACLLGCSQKQIDLASATEIANERLQAHAKASGFDASSLPPPKVEKRADEWVFRWEEPKRDFSLVVIVRTNGEHFDAPKNVPAVQPAKEGPHSRVNFD